MSGALLLRLLNKDALFRGCLLIRMQSCLVCKLTSLIYGLASDHHQHMFPVVSENDQEND